MQKNVTEIYIDGSFATAKERPSDADVIYVCPVGEDPDKWDLIAPSRRTHLKRYHRIDLWLYPSPQPGKSRSQGLITIKEYFQSDLDNKPKGIIRLKLGGSDDSQ